MEEMMTVKEWAEKSGLKLFNYDGFTYIYSKLSENYPKDFYEDTSVRFRDAGDLMCTRRGFQSGLSECTMAFPRVSEFDKMADVIPDFIESHINFMISSITSNLKNSNKPQEVLKADSERLLELLKHKEIAREKSIKINKVDKETQISDINERDYSQDNFNLIKEHSGTVEELEQELSKEAIQSLENILNQGNINVSELPLDKIAALTSLVYSSARKNYTEKPIEEEFMYIDIPGKEKEPFEKEYRMIGPDGVITEGIAFDVPTENGGRVSGTIKKPTINIVESEENIENNIESKEDIENKDSIANKERIENIQTKEDTNRAIQVIDSEVKPEERRGLIAKIKEFTKKILDKINGKNEGR